MFVVEGVLLTRVGMGLDVSLEGWERRWALVGVRVGGEKEVFVVCWGKKYGN